MPARSRPFFTLAALALLLWVLPLPAARAADGAGVCREGPDCCPFGLCLKCEPDKIKEAQAAYRKFKDAAAQKAKEAEEERDKAIAEYDQVGPVWAALLEHRFPFAAAPTLGKEGAIEAGAAALKVLIKRTLPEKLAEEIAEGIELGTAVPILDEIREMLVDYEEHVEEAGEHVKKVADKYKEADEILRRAGETKKKIEELERICKSGPTPEDIYRENLRALTPDEAEAMRSGMEKSMKAYRDSEEGRKATEKVEALLKSMMRESGSGELPPAAFLPVATSQPGAGSRGIPRKYKNQFVFLMTQALTAWKAIDDSHEKLGPALRRLPARR